MNEKNNGRTRVYEKVAKGEEKKDLYAKYVLMPFTTLYMQSPHARERKKYWEEQGISDLGGRNVDPLRGFRVDESKKDTLIASSFNPVLAEVVYKWFAPEGAVVLDPFAGGMTRGAIAARMGLHYVGFDVRKEQIDSNYAKFAEFEKEGDIRPLWICADSKEAMPSLESILGDLKPNFFFTCPPYWNLEVYSDLKGDISNRKTWEEFLADFKHIISNALSHIGEGCYAAIVVGDIRNRKDGFMLNFDVETIKIFEENGFKLTNRCSVGNPPGLSTMRVETAIKFKKLVKTHQDLLIFQRPYSLKTITEMRRTMTDAEIAEKLHMSKRHIENYSRREGNKLYGK